MCKGYSKYGKTKYTLMRHSNIYGPYDKFDLEKSHVFGATINKVINAEQGGEIIIWGDGKEERDLLYVDDLVNFVEAAINRQESKYEIYNVGSGKGISIANLVKKIIKVSGQQDLEIKYDTSKPTIKTNICLDSKKARTDFGWKPEISLDEGIKRTIKWYKENEIKK